MLLSPLTPTSPPKISHSHDLFSHSLSPPLVSQYNVHPAQLEKEQPPHHCTMMVPLFTLPGTIQAEELYQTEYQRKQPPSTSHLAVPVYSTPNHQATENYSSSLPSTPEMIETHTAIAPGYKVPPPEACSGECSTQYSVLHSLPSSQSPLASETSRSEKATLKERVVDEW